MITRTSRREFLNRAVKGSALAGLLDFIQSCRPNTNQNQRTVSSIPAARVPRS
jgi:hypothetical protein